MEEGLQEVQEEGAELREHQEEGVGPQEEGEEHQEEGVGVLEEGEVGEGHKEGEWHSDWAQ